MVEFTRTERGFACVDFQDDQGRGCSLQKSSVATEDYIWFGYDEIGLKRFEPGLGWSDVVLPSGELPGSVSYISNNRMHLNRQQVSDVLPYLHQFVNTGELELEEDTVPHDRIIKVSEKQFNNLMYHLETRLAEPDLVESESDNLADLISVVQIKHTL